MAKKSSTVYLEEVFWNMITEYQNNKGLSSRNDALQLILQEWDILRKIDFSNISINVASENNINSKQIDEFKPPKADNKDNKEDKVVDPRITKGILGVVNTMKEE